MNQEEIHLKSLLLHAELPVSNHPGYRWSDPCKILPVPSPPGQCLLPSGESMCNNTVHEEREWSQNYLEYLNIESNITLHFSGL